MVDHLRYQTCGLLTRWVKGIIFHYSFEFCVLCFQWMSCLLNLDIDYNTFSHIIIICDLICKMQNSVMCGGGLLSKHLDTNHDWQVNNIPCMTGRWISFFKENTYMRSGMVFWFLCFYHRVFRIIAGSLSVGGNAS